MSSAPGEQEDGPKPPFFVGLNMPSSDGRSNRQVVDQALSAGYDMITCRITSRSYRKRVTKIYEEKYASFPSDGHSKPLGSPMLNVESVRNGGKLESMVPPPEVDEVLIQPGDHVANTIALAAPWVEIDAKSPALAQVSLQVLQHEFSYAAFCGVPYIMIMAPKRRTHIAQYAQAVNTLMSQAPLLQVIIHLPFNEDSTVGPNGVPVPPPDFLSIWDLWHMIRTVCNYSPNLSVSLQVPKQALRPYVLSRWFAEPVTMLIVSPKAFVSNAKGFPVLPKSTQNLMFQFFKKNCFVLFEGDDSTSSSSPSLPAPSGTSPSSSPQQPGAGSEPSSSGQAHLLYLRHLHKIAPPQSKAEQFASGYADFLQAPLQPLIDNLESATYEVFERDPVKYNQYELAIYNAILDRPDKRIVVAVVGAGRGGIVDRALSAARAADRQIKVYAVEKNTSAYLYLCQRKRSSNDWSSSVELYKGDMRHWHPEEPVNIMVSELLGSFGDNELSPECLDGAQKYLDPSDGVMIPQSYTSYLTPVMSPRLYTLALNINNSQQSKQSSSGAPSSSNRSNSTTAASLHVPYVVMMQQVDRVSDSIKQMWRFEHPANQVLPENQHNYRHSRKTFDIPHKCVVHGFAGYFEAVLYKDIELSTRPDTMHMKSKDLVSWFPLWLPLSQPIYAVDESEIDLSIWRLTDGRKVWYEWVAESFAVVVPTAPAESPDLNSSNTGASNISQSSSKRSGLGSAMRRIRTGASELHNSGGVHYSMTL